jgi:hypothetical protein
MVLLAGIYHPEGYPYDFTYYDAAPYHFHNRTDHSSLSSHPDLISVGIPINLTVERFAAIRAANILAS